MPPVVSFEGMAQRRAAESLLRSSAPDVAKEVVGRETRKRGMLTLFEKVATRLAARAPAAALAAADGILPIIDTILLVGGVWIIADEVSRHFFESQLLDNVKIKLPGVNVGESAIFPSAKREIFILDLGMDSEPRLDPPVDRGMVIIDPQAETTETWRLATTGHPSWEQIPGTKKAELKKKVEQMDQDEAELSKLLKINPADFSNYEITEKISDIGNRADHEYFIFEDLGLCNSELPLDVLARLEVLRGISWYLFGVVQIVTGYPVRGRSEWETRSIAEKWTAASHSLHIGAAHFEEQGLRDQAIYYYRWSARLIEMASARHHDPGLKETTEFAGDLDAPFLFSGYIHAARLARDNGDYRSSLQNAIDAVRPFLEGKWDPSRVFYTDWIFERPQRLSDPLVLIQRLPLSPPLAMRSFLSHARNGFEKSLFDKEHMATEDRHLIQEADDLLDKIK